MQNLISMKPVSFRLMLSSLLLLVTARVSDGTDTFEQCTVKLENEPGECYGSYAKAVEPTLSPAHLKDLPGFTRSLYKRNYALITPESHVFSPLPGWQETTAAYLITPATGSHFSMYLAKMGAGASSGLPAIDAERFIFVLEGSLTLLEDSEDLQVDSFVYLPPNITHTLQCDTHATILVFEKRYHRITDENPSLIVGRTCNQPILATPGEVFVLRKLLPTSKEYDFNIHVMDFAPGDFLNVKEVHYNQHGLLMLEGHGIYRLGDDWYGALGRTRTQYLLYKDVNRDPLLNFN